MTTEKHGKIKVWFRRTNNHLYEEYESEGLPTAGMAFGVYPCNNEKAARAVKISETEQRTQWGTYQFAHDWHCVEFDRFFRPSLNLTAGKNEIWAVIDALYIEGVIARHFNLYVPQDLLESRGFFDVKNMTNEYGSSAIDAVYDLLRAVRFCFGQAAETQQREFIGQGSS